MTPDQFIEGLLDRLKAAEWSLLSVQQLADLVSGTIGARKQAPSGGESLVIKASPHNWTVRTDAQGMAVARASLSFDFSDDHASDSAAQKAATNTFRKYTASISKKLGAPLPLREEELAGARNAAQLEVAQWKPGEAVVLLELKHEDRELPYEVALSLRWAARSGRS